MRRAAAVLAVSFAVPPTSAAAASVDESRFRYTRTLTATAAAEPILVEPDARLFAHTSTGFDDLRIIAADGRQVPWRALPEAPAPARTRVVVLNRGSRGPRAVALLDLGMHRQVVDRLELAIPQRNFVGHVEARGADTRRGPFTRLSTTKIYDIAGARRARSTTVLLPPTDFRYLFLLATGVRTITSATISRKPPSTRLDPRRAVVRTRSSGRRTISTLDLGFPRVPVDRLRMDTTTQRFDRPVTVAGSNDGRVYFPLAAARIVRFGERSQLAVPVGAAHRFLRVTVDNGDDPPLRRFRVRALARPRTLLVAGGYAKPYRLLYGNRKIGPPEYDFAELPPSQLALGTARAGRLTHERVNPEFGLRPTESFFERHGWIAEAALALAAVVVGATGFVALRRRA